VHEFISSSVRVEITNTYSFGQRVELRIAVNTIKPRPQRPDRQVLDLIAHSFESPAL
jgi:hypothetical protein